MSPALVWGVILGSWFGIIIIGMIIQKKEDKKEREEEK